MNVIVFGSTGMVGSGVLTECIEDPRVGSVLVMGRTPCGVAHPKLRELIRTDFFDYRDANAHLKGLIAEGKRLIIQGFFPLLRAVLFS